jgi:polygalacturonase
MKKYIVLASMLCCLTIAAGAKKKAQVAQQPTFPDGTPVLAWFSDTTKIDVATLGRQYVVTDYGVRHDSTQVQTKQLQKVIDRCASDGGGVVVIPKGTFLTGALFFKAGTHLHFEDGGKLKGVDAIKHYPLVDMHMEGLPVRYFAALSMPTTTTALPLLATAPSTVTPAASGRNSGFAASGTRSVQYGSPPPATGVHILL